MFYNSICKVDINRILEEVNGTFKSKEVYVLFYERLPL